MKNEQAKEILINSYYNGLPDVRTHAGYALTWHPYKKAEDIYIDMTKNLPGTSHEMLYAINALGEIKSDKGRIMIENIVNNPKEWRPFYEAYKTLRKINNEELSKEILDALEVMRKAKFADKIDKNLLFESQKVLLANKNKVIPDLIDICFMIEKASINNEGLNFIYETVQKMGKEVYLYLKAALNSEYNIQQHAKELAGSIGFKY